ncbi:uncharacterized protein CEXT_299851 [Caerostris extrusa]|uniref:Uncharacterized protein n=1 Tax=Caerostris extrusa TaxID=172846 RepID=A0AAV4UJP2_CAEEX|nr:uncharacterized protein CEXT_299851 [Caerostris extrusa]
MNNKYGREIGLGVSCHVYGSLNCKGCCSGGQTGPLKDEKHVHFLDDGRGHDEDEHDNFYRDDKQDVCGNDKLRLSYQYSTDGLCTCCKEASSQSRSQGFGRPILLYEIPKPKFDGISIHQSDFTPKPLPFRDLPHGIQSLKIAGNFQRYLVSTRYSPDILEQHRRLHQVDGGKQQFHGPDCEKHCYSDSLMCHVETPKDKEFKRKTVHFQGDGNMMIPDIQECDTAVCVTKDDLTLPSQKPTYQRSQNVPGDGYERSSAEPDKFTLCENQDNMSKYWWKRLTKKAPMEDTEIRDIPPHMVIPFGPYRTMYQKISQSHQMQHIYNSNWRLKTSQQGCSCTGRLTLTGRIANPKIERGGLS